MLSKEEIEKDIKLLKSISECFTCSMWSEDTEALRRILKHLEQLKSDKQKLIEKLEEDKKKWQEFHNRVPEVPEYIDYILPFVKGENDEC